jgi:hypothetical protein
MELIDDGPVFIQWKGTNVCADLTCPKCGEGEHFDGMFLYYWKCRGCGTMWQLGCHVALKETDDKHADGLIAAKACANPIPDELAAARLHIAQLEEKVASLYEELNGATA